LKFRTLWYGAKKRFSFEHVLWWLLPYTYILCWSCVHHLDVTTVCLKRHYELSERRMLAAEQYHAAQKCWLSICWANDAQLISGLVNCLLTQLDRPFLEVRLDHLFYSRYPCNTKQRDNCTDTGCAQSSSKLFIQSQSAQRWTPQACVVAHDWMRRPKMCA